MYVHYRLSREYVPGNTLAIIFELKTVFNTVGLPHHMKEKHEKKDKFRITKTQNLVII